MSAQKLLLCGGVTLLALVLHVPIVAADKVPIQLKRCESIVSSEDKCYQLGAAVEDAVTLQTAYHCDKANGKYITCSPGGVVSMGKGEWVHSIAHDQAPLDASRPKFTFRPGYNYSFFKKLGESL